MVRAEDALAGRTSYDYDRWDQLTRVTDARANATEYAYDEFARLTKESPPGGSSYATAYQYNGMDMLTKKTAPGDSAATYAYDAANRLTQVQGPGVLNAYWYNVNSQLSQGYDTNVCMTVNANDVMWFWVFGYDADGRQTSESLRTNDWTTQYPLGRRIVAYDAAGRRTKQAFYSANRTNYLNLDTYQTYAYDSTKHRLTRIQRESSGTDKAEYFYDDTDGRLTKMSYGNGAYAAYLYDASGALTKICNIAKDWYYSYYNMADVGYWYDAAGNVTRMDRGDGGDGYYTPEPVGGTSTYQYDNLHRLTYEYFSTQASTTYHDWGYKYCYDSVGNRTKHRFYNWEHDWYYDEYMEQWYPVGDWEDRMTYEYSSRNELTKTTDRESNATVFQYDLRGNLTKRGSTEYYWDSADHMTKVVKDNVATEYKYDLLGRRVAKKVGNGAWRWFFFDGLKVIAEGTGTAARTFYTQGPGVIGGVICADGLTFYHYDRLGTLIATSNEYGEVSQTFETTSAFGGSAIFTGKQYDGDAGLYYFNARWYDPSTGRFVSKDLMERINAYVYVDCRPLVYVDHSGLFKVCIRPVLGKEWLPIAHCFIDLGGGDTYAYFDGIKEDNRPNHPKKQCAEAKCHNRCPSNEEIRDAVATDRASGKWDSNDYKKLSHNCCHWADSMLKRFDCEGVESHFPGYWLPFEKERY